MPRETGHFSVENPGQVSVEINTLDAWQGPLNGLQDFFIGTGAIEVKATIAPQGFPAKISSLDQLDETQRQPLFLAGVRLALGLALRANVNETSTPRKFTLEGVR